MSDTVEAFLDLFAAAIFDTYGPNVEETITEKSDKEKSPNERQLIR